MGAWGVGVRGALPWSRGEMRRAWPGQWYQGEKGWDSQKYLTGTITGTWGLVPTLMFQRQGEKVWSRACPSLP